MAAIFPQITKIPILLVRSAGVSCGSIASTHTLALHVVTAIRKVMQRDSISPGMVNTTLFTIPVRLCPESRLAGRHFWARGGGPQEHYRGKQEPYGSHLPYLFPNEDDRPIATHPAA